jgi:serine/threonine protein phosphatase PrpC
VKAQAWCGWGVSVIGPAHRRMGLPNQDAWMARDLGEGAVLAVSDGMGSCSHAETGSRAACSAVLETIRHRFGCDAVSLDGLPGAIHQRWEANLGELDPADCSATCLFAATHRKAGTIFAQLGDGFIAGLAENGTVDLLTPDKSEGFLNLTVGLASRGAIDRWQTTLVDDRKYIALVACTDGIADDIEDPLIHQFVQAIYEHYCDCSHAERTRDVRRWLQHWPVPGHSDDKTIACIFRTGNANA